MLGGGGINMFYFPCFSETSSSVCELSKWNFNWYCNFSVTKSQKIMISWKWKISSWHKQNET